VSVCSIGMLTVTHQESACGAASVHFGPMIRRTDVFIPHCSTNHREFSAFLHFFIPDPGHSKIYKCICFNPLITTPSGKPIACDLFTCKWLWCFVSDFYLFIYLQVCLIHFTFIRVLCYDRMKVPMLSGRKSLIALSELWMSLLPGYSFIIQCCPF